MSSTETALRHKIASLEAELFDLRAELTQLNPCNVANDPGDAESLPSGQPHWCSAGHGLSKEQVARYSRHLILPAFGAEGGPAASSHQYTSC